MAETPTFGRYAEIPYDKMTPEQQEGFNSLMESRGRLPGPAKIYVHNPKLAKVLGPFGAHFRGPYSLSEREREIAVCVINSKFHTAYATNAHERAAKAAGLPSDKVEAILSGLHDLVRRQARAGGLRDGDVPVRSRAGCRRDSTSARSKRWAMSASPT